MFIDIIGAAGGTVSHTEGIARITSCVDDICVLQDRGLASDSSQSHFTLH